MISVQALSGAVISALSGLLGYKLAVTQNQQGISDYITVVAISAIAQALFSAIASNRKDRLKPAHHKYRRSLRAGLSIHICLASTMATIFLALIMEENRSFFILLALSLVGISLQQATFEETSRELVRLNGRFWDFQFRGAIIRLGLTLLFIVALEWHYFGIVLSNIGAATVICRCYASWPTIKVSQLSRLNRAIRKGALLATFTLDGILRASKNQFENCAISLSALIIASYSELPSAQRNANLISVGYVNTLMTILRQTFNQWEHPEHQQNRSINILIFAAFPFISIIFGLIALHTNLATPFLPQIEKPLQDQIAIICCVTLAAFPLTRGFLYVDYLAPRILKRFWIILASSFALIISALFLITSLFNSQVIETYAWPALTILSIFIAVKNTLRN